MGKADRMTMGHNDTVAIDTQRREIAAMRNVVRMMQANSKRYSVRALSLMTIGRGALQTALRYV